LSSSWIVWISQKFKLTFRKFYRSNLDSKSLRFRTPSAINIILLVIDALYIISCSLRNNCYSFSNSFFSLQINSRRIQPSCFSCINNIGNPSDIDVFYIDKLVRYKFPRTTAEVDVPSTYGTLSSFSKIVQIFRSTLFSLLWAILSQRVSFNSTSVKSFLPVLWWFDTVYNSVKQ